MPSQSVNILVNARDKTGKGFGGARAGLKRLSGAVFSLKGALGGLAAGFAMRAVISSLSETADKMDKVAKTSDRLGIATEELIAFRHAAEISGSDVATMDKAIEKMSVNLGKAVIEGGTFADVFTDIGLDATALSTLSADEKFRQISDAINLLPSAAMRAAAANNVFGRSGVKLLNTIALGSKGLNEFRQEADELGITFSRFDAAKVEAANDALLRMGTIFDGVKQDLVVELSPLVQALSEEMQHLAGRGEGFKDWLPTLQSVGITFGVVADAVTILSDAFNVLQAAVTQSFAVMVKGLAMVKPFAAALPKSVQFAIGALELATGDIGVLAEGLQREATKQIEDAKERIGKPLPSTGIEASFMRIEKRANAAAAAIANSAKEKAKLEAGTTPNSSVTDFIGAVGGGLTTAKGLLGNTLSNIGNIDFNPFSRRSGSLTDLLGKGTPAQKKEEEEKKQSLGIQSLAATESRFLTRGRGGNPQAEALKEQKKATKATVDSAKIAKDLRKLSETANSFLESLLSGRLVVTPAGVNG